MYRFFERINITSSPGADTNNDSRISVREAHFYAVKQHPLENFNKTIQHPQIDIWDNLHVVWADKRDGNWEIYYSKLGSIVNCSASNNGVDLTRPDINVSYKDGKDSGRVITNPVDYADAKFIEHPDIAIDSNHSLHIVWSDNRSGKWQIYYQKQDNSNPPNVLIDDTKISGTNTDVSQCPAIYVDDDDIIHIAWQDNANNGIWEIMYQKQYNNGTVIIDDKLATSNDGYNSTVPDIAVDSGKRVYIAYMDDRNKDPCHESENTHKKGYWEVYTLALSPFGDRYYEKRQSDMNDPRTWGGVYTGPPDGYSMYPRIEVSSDTFLTWHDNRSGNWEVFYSEVSNGCNNPNSDINVSKNSNADLFPDIALDRNNNPDIEWQRSGSWKIYGTRWNGKMFITVEIDGESHHIFPGFFPFPGDDMRDGPMPFVYGSPLSRGSHTIKFHTSNGLLTTSSSEIPGPTINNNPPILEPIPDPQVAYMNEAYYYDVNAYDFDGDQLTYEIKYGGIPLQYINPDTGEINFNVPFTGTFDLNISVTDGISHDYQIVTFIITQHTPEVIIDNVDPDFLILSGTWPSINNGNAYGGSARYNNPGVGTEQCGWRVDRLVGYGTYDVFVHLFEHPYLYLMATNAQYTIHYKDGIDTVFVDQSIPYTGWVYLGTYCFDDSSMQGIVLSDDANGYVSADAVKLVLSGT